MSATTSFDYMEFAAALGGSTAAIYFVAGVEPMDAVTSFSGALGAAAGYSAGSYLASSQADSQYAYLYPMAGAVLVPGLASGAWDMNTFVLGAGAIAGCKVYKMWKDKSVV